jgi:glycine/D-amino acid oxidase-like deaminating enzyme
MPEFGTLQADMHADVCVVGEGIAGLTTAYLLACEGMNVVVLEAGQIGDGQTGRTTAHLSFALDDRFFELERLFGTEGARLAAESHATAIDRIEAIVRDENIDCDFRRLDGYLFAAPGKEDQVEKELKAARRAHVPGVEMLSRAPLPFDSGPCLRFPR